MPLTREAIEVALDLVTQFVGPTIGIESSRAPCGYPHRVIRTTHAGGPMTFDRHRRQMLNYQFLRSGLERSPVFSGVAYPSSDLASFRDPQRARHTKFAASSVLPFPVYSAACG